MLKRWQELAEPSFSSCLQTIPGVYTRAEILQGVKEENEDDLNNSDPETDGSESSSFLSLFLSIVSSRSNVVQSGKIFTGNATTSAVRSSSSIPSFCQNESLISGQQRHVE